MILAKKEILSELEKGSLKITPLNKSNVGACSVDLTLGKSFRVLKGGKRVLVVSENVNELMKETELIELNEDESIKLKPNKLILGITEETIKMPNYLCGLIEGRSRFARIGLMVHISSSLIQPGVENKQVLEIVNLSKNTLILRPGLTICQVVFERLSSPALHHGVFAKQKKP